MVLRTFKSDWLAGYTDSFEKYWSKCMMHYMLEIDIINNGDIQIWGATFVWCCICVSFLKYYIEMWVCDFYWKYIACKCNYCKCNNIGLQ